MKDNELLQKFPTKRLHAFDGMAVTAQAWQEAHDYHRAFQNFKTLLYHGEGIMRGLEVVASSPPSSVLIIKPGVAVDSDGRTIVIQQETPINIGNQKSGLLRLLLRYSDSNPRANSAAGAAADLRYVHQNFTITVNTNSDETSGQYIELARLKRQTARSAIVDVGKSNQKGLNEIDMSRRKVATQSKAKERAPQQSKAKERAPELDLMPKLNALTSQQEALADKVEEVRRELTMKLLAGGGDSSGRSANDEEVSLLVGLELEDVRSEQKRLANQLEGLTKQIQKLETISQSPPPPQIDVSAPREVIKIGISYLGNQNTQKHGRGIHLLARALSRASAEREISVEDNISLTHSLTPYTIVFLVGEQRFNHSSYVTVLRNYLQTAGTLFIESCHQRIGRGRVPSDESFMSLSDRLGIRAQFQSLRPPHPLLEEPHIFAALPMGFADWRKPMVQVAEGVIWSRADYGCLWRGERHSSPPSREEIRAAIEWGSNVIEYAVKRKAARSA